MDLGCEAEQFVRQPCDDLKVPSGAFLAPLLLLDQALECLSKEDSTLAGPFEGHLPELLSLETSCRDGVTDLVHLKGSPESYATDARPLGYRREAIPRLGLDDRLD